MPWENIGPARYRWVDGPGASVPKVGTAPAVIPDIQPYKAVAGDMAGKWIKSRKEHREFLKRNGFIEVGNEHRQYFEYGGKSRDNPFAERSKSYRREDFEGRASSRRR